MGVLNTPTPHFCMTVCTRDATQKLFIDLWKNFLIIKLHLCLLESMTLTDVISGGYVLCPFFNTFPTPLSHAYPWRAQMLTLHTQLGFAQARSHIYHVTTFDNCFLVDGGRSNHKRKCRPHPNCSKLSPQSRLYEFRFLSTWTTVINI